MSHASVMDLLGDPTNPLYAEPLSMAEHFDAITAGTCAIGELSGQTRCRDEDATTRVYKDKAKQVLQKILRYLDMRVMDGDLIVLKSYFVVYVTPSTSKSVAVLGILYSLTVNERLE